MLTNADIQSPKRAARRARAELRILWMAAAATVLAASGAWGAPPGPGDQTMPKYAGKVNAPEFPEGMEWLNTSRPVSLFQLRGKVVLLDFWTFCCINCMHIIPDLKKLEAKYADELVVIGVHTAKFTAEKDTDNIRQAIVRYGIEHPVVNDRDFRIWRAYGAHAWPTLVLIDPEGKVVGTASGEGIYRAFDELIGDVVKEFDATGRLDRRKIRFDLERDKTPESILAFPGKVLADAASNRLFVADSNHDRIVVAALDTGNIVDVIGDGTPGLDDGSFAESTFRHPQGMALDGSDLYVADTENHAIRRVDFAARNVTTIAGDGIQKPIVADTTTPPPPRPRLNSPWDVTLVGKRLYIAMAGPHQLWVMDLESGDVRPYAGCGSETRVDGTLATAALAQPSGITTDGARLYFADSETSSIRWADLPPGDRVGTVVGQDLFDYGDVDGTGDKVRLQHPLGVVYAEGHLFVADTYNNKIKRIDAQKRKSESFAGSGEAGYRDGKKARFDEPGGISYANGKLYVADTNNHVIRVIDVATKRVSTFMFRGIETLARKRGGADDNAPFRDAGTQIIAPGSGRLVLTLSLPDRHELNPLAPSRLILDVDQTAGSSPLSFEGGRAHVEIDRPQFPVTVPLAAASGEGRLRAEMVLYYCAEGKEALCFFDDVRLEVAVTVKPGTENNTVSLSHAVQPSQ
jgi:DNA-binding beta-propeller fold protein YncE